MVTKDNLYNIFASFKAVRDPLPTRAHRHHRAGVPQPRRCLRGCSGATTLVRERERGMSER